MSKATVATSPLFVDSETARTAGEDVLAALIAVRAAKRFCCKAESANGQKAHQDLHAAEKSLERAMKTLGVERR